MKLVAKAEASIKSDPRSMERANWQYVAQAVDHEAAHRDWRCALYRLHRIGRINNDQREAGDKYLSLVQDFRALWRDPIGFAIEVPNQQRDYDVRCEETKPVVHALGLAHAEGIRELSEFETKRAKKLSKRYREAKEVAGPARMILEELLVEDTWPTGERQHVEIGHALTRLSHFFSTGTKRVRSRGRK
jgi:hypothetical protein